MEGLNGTKTGIQRNSITHCANQITTFLDSPDQLLRYLLFKFPRNAFYMAIFAGQLVPKAVTGCLYRNRNRIRYFYAIDETRVFN